MRKIFFSAVMIAAANAQVLSRSAVITGGGNPEFGQCTVEVVVDATAQVEIRGTNATLRNLAGQSPQWRRFECTTPLPPNPIDFRFEGVDGRGRQQLTADPRNGGTAIVRIDDPQGGAEGYTFRLVWRNTAPAVPPPTYSGPPQPDQDYYHRERERSFRGNDWRSQFFRRIREDLAHAAATAPPFGGDYARLERTNFELDELQEKLSQGFYDEQELDEVIGALQVVVRNNRLTRQDRSILSDDLSRMRDFRVRHDEYGARDRDEFYHQTRDRFDQGNWRERFFQNIRTDVDHAAAVANPFGGDQQRLTRTRHELDELQEKLSRGYYDEQELDEVMGALQVVLSSNRLGPRDRDILNDDLARMRDFRIRHDQYGAH